MPTIDSIRITPGSGTKNTASSTTSAAASNNIAPGGVVGPQGPPGIDGAPGPAGNMSSLPFINVTYCGESQYTNDNIGNIPNSGISRWDGGGADVIYDITSNETITESGIIQFYSGIVDKTLGLSSSGQNGIRFLTGRDEQLFTVMVYVSTSLGTVYSAPFTGHSRPLCLAEGTMISLWNGKKKPVEEITYNDDLLVWDFDNGKFANVKPLWIKKPTKSLSYNLLTFSDDTTLRTVGQHRIFNKESGKFTYPLTDDTPIGTTTFNVKQQEISLVDKIVLENETNSYNIITNYHMNLFADGILTSNSFNNIYPIENMKFIKDMKEKISKFDDIPNKFHYGMRLHEQNISYDEIKNYIDRLIMTGI